MVKLLVIILLIVNVVLARELTLEREYTERYTLGYIKELKLLTIEPPKYSYSFSKKFSCIKEGRYRIQFERMETYGLKEIRIILLDSITGRSDRVVKTHGGYTNGIFFHEGNTLGHTIGCILVGRFKDVIFNEYMQLPEIKSYEASIEGLEVLEEYFLQGRSKESLESKKLDFYINIIENKPSDENRWYKMLTW